MADICRFVRTRPYGVILRSIAWSILQQETIASRIPTRLTR